MSSQSALATTVPLAITDRGSNRVNVDGILTDWERFTELSSVDDRGNVLRGDGAWTGPDDASFSFALAQDAQGLYLAARVRDDALVRSAAHRGDEDALVLTLAAPGATPNAAAHVEELVFYPGDPGNYAGVVRTRGGRVLANAQIVEAPARGGGGITIEAMVPWAALGPIAGGRNALRARLAYQDADDSARPATDSLVSTGPGDVTHADQLPPVEGSTGAALDGMVNAFRQQRSLVGVPPLFDRTVNVAGDAALERVLLYPGVLMAAGPGINGGTSYAYLEAPVQSQADLVEAQTRDVTGDGAHEVLLTVRQREGGMQRDVLIVYGATNGSPRLGRIFSHELARVQGGNSVRSRLTIESNGSLQFALGEASGFTASNFPRTTEEGVEMVLLPWGPHRSETWRWADNLQRFDRTRTETNPNAVAEASARPAAPSPGGGAGPLANEPAPPDVSATLALFRRQRSIAEGARPTFSQQADVAEDATPETVQVFGRVVVVVGTAFMGGRSFYTMELPEGSEVVAVQLGDVTNDGKAEAIVRIRRQTPLMLRGQSHAIVRDNLLVYSFDSARRGRVFAGEVARRDGSDAIENTVRPVAPGRNGTLVIDAGRPSGWSRETYPFRDAPNPGFAPLVLPWERESVTYRWNGTALAP